MFKDSNSILDVIKSMMDFSLLKDPKFLLGNLKIHHPKIIIIYHFEFIWFNLRYCSALENVMSVHVQ